MNSSMNAELKKVVTRVKAAQEQLQSMLKDKTWVEDARKYAERQGKEVKKLLSSDVNKMRDFLERERKELERFQKQIPGEVKKFKKFVNVQKKEFEKILVNMRSKNFAAASKSAGKTATQSTRSSTKKTAGAKKSAASTGTRKKTGAKKSATKSKISGKSAR